MHYHLNSGECSPKKKSFGWNHEGICLKLFLNRNTRTIANSVFNIGIFSDKRKNGKSIGFYVFDTEGV